MYTPLLSLSSVYFCLHSFYLAASSAYLFLCAWLFTPVLTWPVLYLCAIHLFIYFIALCPSPVECNCSGRSEACVFDMEQYRSTGSGGRCVSCRDNTDGPHCEHCRENHYRKSADEPCLPCNCNINGNLQIQIPLLL